MKRQPVDRQIDRAFRIDQTREYAGIGAAEQHRAEECRKTNCDEPGR